MAKIEERSEAKTDRDEKYFVKNDIVSSYIPKCKRCKQLKKSTFVNMKFDNHRFLIKQSLELLNTTLLIQKKSLFEYSGFEISYEHINNKKKIESSINNNFLFISFSFIIVGVLFLLGTLSEISPLLIIIGLFLLIITFLNRKKTITISCFDGNNIELYFTNNNKAEVLLFSDQIINSSNAFLLNKYGKVDKDLPVDNQLNKLEFLRNREIITEKEF